MEQHDLLNNDLSVNPESQAYLLTASKWGKFLAIVGIIFCAIIILGGIIATAFLSTIGSSLNTSRIPFLQYLGAVYLVLGIIMFFPCLYLLKFSNKIQEALRASSQESLNTAFLNLKSLFKFYGILTLVFLGMYALVFIAGIAGMFAR